MNNKEQIKKLKDNAELAMAAYGYFHFEGKRFKDSDKIITMQNILDIAYKGYEVKDTGWIFDDELKGEFAPLQAKRFFERYDLLIHQPNTDSGFSATLFGEKRKQTHTNTKKVSYTNKYGYVNYIFAIRGTKPDDTGDLKADTRLVLSSIPQGQYEDMLKFYNQCKIKYPAMIESKSLNIVGHSLGGALAQMLTLSLCDNNNEANINEVYTFNLLYIF